MYQEARQGSCRDGGGYRDGGCKAEFERGWKRSTNGQAHLMADMRCKEL